MHIRSLSCRLVIAGMLLTFIIPVQIAQTTQAQGPAPFLTTPYYGHHGITSYFDHEYPNYGTNSVLMTYDGVPHTVNILPTNCANPGGKCYDGHNGYDFALNYETVLAAADGIIATSGWYAANCRIAIFACGYGLRAEIDHGNSYITRYGHLSAVMGMGLHVTAGQAIGNSGNTGNSSGAHLHFDVRDTSGNQFDPFGWQGGGSDPNSPASWCMWKDGEWANNCGGPSRPVPDIVDGDNQIVDDLTLSFSKTCTGGTCPYWYEANYGYLSHMWWTYVNGTVPNYHASWAPYLSTPGRYEVRVYVPCQNATSWQAPYTIINTSGYGAAVVDQYGLCNQWVSIGAYTFPAGYYPNNYYVAVFDNTGDESQHCSGTCKVGVDAAQFLRRGRGTCMPIMMHS